MIFFRSTYLIAIVALVLSSCSDPASVGDQPLSKPGQLDRILLLFGENGEKSVDVTVVLPTDYDAGSVTPYPAMVALPPGLASVGEIEFNILEYWYTEALARGYVLISPHLSGLSMIDEAPELMESIFVLLEAINVDPEKVVISGADVGGVGAYDTIIQEPDRFKAMIGIPAIYDRDVAELDALNGKPIWLMVGAQDFEWKEIMDENVQELESRGALVEYTVLENQEHTLSIDSEEVYDWIDTVLGLVGG